MNILKVMILTTWCAALLQCGGESNLFYLTLPAQQEAAFDVELAKARSYYNSGSTVLALEHAKKAASLNPDSEKAAMLLGYIYLELAEMSPYKIVAKLNEDKSSDEEETSSTETGEESNNENSPEQNEGGDPSESNETQDESSEDKNEESSSESLGELTGIVGLTNAEFSLLGTIDVNDPSLPIIIPSCAGEARNAVYKLRMVNQAILAICKFVDKDILIGEELRHRCISNKNIRAHRSENHFLWAIAHLTEALTFYSVLLYSSDGTASNLEKRSEKIELDIKNASNSIEGIQTMITSLDSFATIIDSIFQLSGVCSEKHPQTQVVALVNDLISVSMAFSRLNGVPKSIVNKIEKAIKRINDIRKRTQGVAASKEQATSIKEDITKKMAKALDSAVGDLDPNNLSTEQKNNLCASLKSIGNSSDVNPLCKT